MSGTLLCLIMSSFLLPTVFSNHIDYDDTEGPALDLDHILRISRAASVLLIFLYLCFLIQQFWTHQRMFTSSLDHIAPQPPKNRRNGLIRPTSLGITSGLQAGVVGLGESNAQSFHATIARLPAYYPNASTGKRKPRLHLGVAIVLFLTTAALLAVCVEFTVQSIDDLASQAGVSQTFIGLVLVPIPNCDTAPISHALKGDIQKCIDLTVGKCLQTMLLVYPLCIMIAWGLGHIELSLVFDSYYMSIVFTVVFYLNLPLRHGRLSW